MWSRIYLIPLLQAEEDRDQIRRYWADKEREKVLLGTDIKIYNSDRYVERIRDVDAPAFLSLGLVEIPTMSCERGLDNCIADWSSRQICAAYICSDTSANYEIDWCIGILVCVIAYPISFFLLLYTLSYMYIVARYQKTICTRGEATMA